MYVIITFKWWVSTVPVSFTHSAMFSVYHRLSSVTTIAIAFFLPGILLIHCTIHYTSGKWIIACNLFIFIFIFDFRIWARKSERATFCAGAGRVRRRLNWSAVILSVTGTRFSSSDFDYTVAHNTCIRTVDTTNLTRIIRSTWGCMVQILAWFPIFRFGLYSDIFATSYL